MLSVEKKDALDQAERFSEALGDRFRCIEPQPDGIYFVWYAAEDGTECAQAFSDAGPVRSIDGEWIPLNIPLMISEVIIRIGRDRERFEVWKNEAAKLGQDDFVHRIQGFDDYARMIQNELIGIMEGGDNLEIPRVYRI